MHAIIAACALDLDQPTGDVSLACERFDDATAISHDISDVLRKY